MKVTYQCKFCNKDYENPNKYLEHMDKCHYVDKSWMRKGQHVYHAKKECYCCGSRTTITNSKNGCEEWRLNHDPDDTMLCFRCYQHLIGHPKFNPLRSKEEIARTNLRRIKFKDRIVHVKINPRIGVCNNCRAVIPWDTDKTAMHHEEYDDINPLANTIELCRRCHTRRTWELGQYTKKLRNNLPQTLLSSLCIV